MFKTRPSVHHSQLINWSNLFQRVATNLNIFKPERFYLWALYKALCDIKITRLLRLDRMKLSHFWVFMLIFNFIHCTGGRKMILKNSFMKNEKIRFYIWETKGAILLHFPSVSNFIFILAVTTDCGCQMPCKIQIYGETLWQPGQFITGSEPGLVSSLLSGNEWLPPDWLKWQCYTSNWLFMAFWQLKRWENVHSSVHQ